MCVEEPALEERHTEHREVMPVDALMLRERRVLRRRARPAVDQESQAPCGVERKKVCKPGIDDARLHAEIGQQLIVKAGDLLEVVVAGRQIDVDRHDVRRPEARVLVNQTLETTTDERRADEQHDRETHFGHHQHAAGSTTGACRRRRALIP